VRVSETRPPVKRTGVRGRETRERVQSIRVRMSETPARVQWVYARVRETRVVVCAFRSPNGRNKQSHPRGSGVWSGYAFFERSARAEAGEQGVRGGIADVERAARGGK
jgi:hypothetical protein